MTKQKLTGQNFLYALGAAAAVVLAISAIFIGITTIAEGEFMPPLQIIYGVAFCFGPIVFLATFALLQRFRTDKFNL